MSISSLINPENYVFFTKKIFAENVFFSSIDQKNRIKIVALAIFVSFAALYYIVYNYINNINKKQGVLVLSNIKVKETNQQKELENKDSLISTIHGINTVDEEQEKKNFVAQSFDLLFQNVTDVHEHRQQLADAVEAGRQLIPKNRPQKGEYTDYLTVFCEFLKKDLLKDRFSLLESVPGFPIITGYINEDDKVEYIKDTGLFKVKVEDVSIERGLLAVCGIINNNHSVISVYDPINKKYIHLNNFSVNPIPLEIKDDKCWKENLFPSTPRREMCILFDTKYSDLILDPKYWREFNKLTPKWQDNNCSLAVDWFLCAYELKLVEILSQIKI